MNPYLGSLTKSFLMKSLASSEVLVKNSSSKVKSTATMFSYVSCCESPRKGEAPDSLQQQHNMVNLRFHNIWNKFVYKYCVVFTTVDISYQYKIFDS